MPVYRQMARGWNSVESCTENTEEARRFTVRVSMIDGGWNTYYPLHRGQHAHTRGPNAGTSVGTVNSRRHRGQDAADSGAWLLHQPSGHTHRTRRPGSRSASPGSAYFEPEALTELEAAVLSEQPARQERRESSSSRRAPWPAGVRLPSKASIGGWACSASPRASDPAAAF